MRILIPPAAFVAAATLCFAPSAFAASGGGAAIDPGAVSAPSNSSDASSSDSSSGSGAQAPAAADPEDDLQTRTVDLTRTQTKTVQKRVGVRADGRLGSRTRVALRGYQRNKALVVTGRPNIQTLRSLRLKLAEKLEARLVAAGSGGVTTAAAPVGTFDSAIAAARSAIGTPYRSGGTTTAGFDCSGLTMWAFKEAGITLKRTSFDQFTQGEAVSKSAIQPGDLVFFDSAGSGASHVGIATSSTKAISATSHGVMEHTFSSGYWAGHYVGARRVT